MKNSLQDSLGESFDIDSNDLVIAIDETGNEEFKDSNFPLFGLSASLFLGKEYYNEISQPWNNFKKIAKLKPIWLSTEILSLQNNLKDTTN